MFEFVNHVWQHLEDVSTVNKTDICLIPKCSNPELVSQFRPISLCNPIYKVITKIIVNRLKNVMGEVISPFQIGFVPGRNIHENIIIAQEMLRSMRKMRGKVGFFAIKVDLSKAYDRLNWHFIENILYEVGLPNKLITLIMHCVFTVNTNVLWNGQRSEFFSPEKGVCQGDPITLSSCFMFR